MTTVTTVANITIEELRGCFLRSAIDCQLNVPIETMIIIAISAAIGIIPTQSPSPTHKIKRNTPAQRVDSLPLPPDLILITDCPIIAQPAIPPINPVKKLDIP